MALPRKLKNFNVFADGESFIGQATEVTLPTLTRSMEDYRGGGMSGPIKIDNGQEAIELEAKFGGLMLPIIRTYAASKHDAVLLRFAGAYQRDDTGAVDAVEITARGRWSELDMGTAKAGDDTEFTGKLACSYYKLTVNGTVELEFDLVNMVEIAGGVDRLTEQRRAIGI
ncbi:MAG: phage major tail tube protein [Pseudomonadota bacterium]|nr:phage major tail tube protein [Pseudomonadota bacterium]